MSIAAVEEHLIGVIKARFQLSGGKSALRGVDSLPSDWDNDVLKRLLRQVPGVFVVWGGGQRIDGSDTDINSTWVIVAVTAHASGEKARRHGDKLEIGAYQIIEVVVPLLRDHVVPPGQERLQFEEVQNLFSNDLDLQGVAAYGARFSLRMPIVPPPGMAADVLDDFLTFDSTLDAAPSDGNPEAQDTVLLPQ
jgi:phage gp37-like protein